MLPLLRPFACPHRPPKLAAPRPHRSLAASLALIAIAAATSRGAAAEATLHGPPATAQSILAQERAFEARSEQAGAPQAFRDFMDPKDGLEFGNGAPTRGAEAIGAGMDKDYAAITLRWTPQEVFASTGDLGVVWGTWIVVPKPPAKPAAKPLTGRYVTVWRRTTAGIWKGLIDIGAPDP